MNSLTHRLGVSAIAIRFFAGQSAAADHFRIGRASVDTTPDRPVAMRGSVVSMGVTDHITATALALEYVSGISSLRARSKDQGSKSRDSDVRGGVCREVQSHSKAQRSTLAAMTLLALATVSPVLADSPTEGAVTINIDFPGSNAKLTANEGGSVHVEPDLRGGRPWFYWCFEATATKPGRVTFVFPEKVAGFKNGAIGFQGPAISTDLGKSWKWMGTDQVDGHLFFYDFTKTNERVRFAVTVPYLQADHRAFIERNASNPHLKTSVLTKSRKGRDVELLRIGTPGPKVKAMLVTGRHHAAETIASYVLEGFLQEAMSESEFGKEFREKYVLYAIPFVDKDGVEEGDQGKNRKPHDHNRDYGEKSIYPEIQAIKKLDKEQNFRFALDFHCPTLVMDIHQLMYFVGPKEHPACNFQNVSEFASWIKKRLPNDAPSGPLVWLRPAKTPAPMNSNYFGFKEGTIMAATLEIPFAPRGKATDPASCRTYGQVILGAWVSTHFIVADQEPAAKIKNVAAPRENTTPVVKLPDKLRWLPSKATSDTSRTDLGGEQILPEVAITATPKPTADASKYTREYVIELEKFNISNKGTNPIETSKGINAALQCGCCRSLVVSSRHLRPRPAFERTDSARSPFEDAGWMFFFRRCPSTKKRGAADARWSWGINRS